MKRVARVAAVLAIASMAAGAGLESVNACQLQSVTRQGWCWWGAVPTMPVVIAVFPK